MTESYLESLAAEQPAGTFCPHDRRKPVFSGERADHFPRTCRVLIHQ